MPQKSTPSAIFWRRRLLAVAVVLALLWVIVQIAGRFGGDDPSRSKTTEPPGSPTATASVKSGPVKSGPVKSGPVKSGPVKSGQVTSGPVRVRLQAAKDACDPQQIRVTPSVRPGQKNRAAVDIAMVISSKLDKSCTLRPSEAEFVTIISSNGQPVWDSTRCPVPLLNEPVNISPEWSTVVATAWSGRLSGGSCAAKEDWAASGSFTIEAGTLGGEPGKSSFELAEGPKPKPKRQPKPTVKPQPKPTPSA